MKKTLMMAAAAATMIASPAFAQYADGVATYEINAKVANFCKFGNVGNTVTNGPNTTNFDRAISIADGDRGFNVDIQNPETNTVRAAGGSFNFANAQCNTPFSVVAQSTNAGLKSDYSGSFTGNFLQTVPYSIAFGPAAQKPTLRTVSRNNILVNNSNPYAGAMTFSFEVAPQNGLLLAGGYTDTVVVTMAPSTGGVIIGPKL